MPSITGISTITGINTMTFTNGILDDYLGAQAAYSLRKLKTSNTKCIRVRRSSDNAEQDIGFTSGGLLDESALTTFTGANDGFVTTWYDQSGNGLDATQGTQGSQPYIVLAGIVETHGSKPAINFGTDAVTRYLVTSNSTGWTDNAGLWQAYTVATLTTYTTSRFCVVVDDSTSNRVAWYCTNSNSGGQGPSVAAWDDAGTVFRNINTITPANNTRFLWYGRRTSSLITLYINNGFIADNATTGTPKVSSNTSLHIGTWGALTFPWLNKIQETIIFPNNTDNRVAISANINSFYSIY